MRRLFIVNPLSERVARKGSTLNKLAPEMGADLHVLDNFNGLPDAITQAATDKIAHILIEGGDGTVQGVLSEILRQSGRFAELPKISIVPGGMTNQVAKNIGLRSAKSAAVKAALSRDLKPITLPMLEVSETDGPIYAGFLFSTGAIPQITEYTTGELHRKGIGGSLAVLGGILKGMRGDDDALMRVTPIEIDGGATHNGDHLGTVITTLPGLIMGLDPFWGDENAPLRLTWVDGAYQRLARNILSLWIGRKDKDRTAQGFHSANRDRVDFRYNGPIVLDGEFLSFPSGKLTVRAGKPVTFLR